MNLFYFHLHQCGELIADEEGAEFPDAVDAIRQAMVEARALLLEETKQGKLCLRCYIEVVNSETAESVTVPFRTAVTLTGA